MQKNFAWKLLRRIRYIPQQMGQFQQSFTIENIFIPLLKRSLYASFLNTNEQLQAKSCWLNIISVLAYFSANSKDIHKVINMLT